MSSSYHPHQMPRPQLPVVRSRQHLESLGVSFLQPGAAPPTKLPILSDGTTYSMAQESTWLDANHFAVGRWDGSLSIFAYTESPTSGPLMTTAASNPSAEGVQMITWLAPGVFSTSHDERSILVWTSPSGMWTDVQSGPPLAYDPTFGAANSGDSFSLGSTLYFVVGHANGYVTIWSGKLDGSEMQLVTSVNVRSAHPVNPWGLYNVRGVATISLDPTTGYVVTGSEDGDLCVLRVPDGQILSRTVYNAAAQRGINSIASLGTSLLVANCSVGTDDKNLWYYRVNPNDWSIQLCASTNLKVNPSAPQVFNFCTVWGMYGDGVCFFASTEEGALWMGTVQDDQNLSIFGYQQVTSPLGSALAFNASGRLVMVSYNLYEFVTTSNGAAAIPRTQNPERLPTVAISPAR